MYMKASRLYARFPWENDEVRSRWRDSKGKGIKWRTGSRKYRKNLPFVTDAMNENVVRGRGKRQPRGV